MHYQPKVHTRTLEVTGVEALVRWQHSTRGLLLPDAFLPLVEDAGLMRDLTDAVLEQSLDQVKRWRSAGRVLSVAVNLSASSLVDAELPLRIFETRDTGTSSQPSPSGESGARGTNCASCTPSPCPGAHISSSPVFRST